MIKIIPHLNHVNFWLLDGTIKNTISRIEYVCGVCNLIYLFAERLNSLSASEKKNSDRAYYSHGHARAHLRKNGLLITSY